MTLQAYDPAVFEPDIPPPPTSAPSALAFADVECLIPKAKLNRESGYLFHVLAFPEGIRVWRREQAPSSASGKSWSDELRREESLGGSSWVSDFGLGLFETLVQQTNELWTFSSIRDVSRFLRPRSAAALQALLHA